MFSPNFKVKNKNTAKPANDLQTQVKKEASSKAPIQSEETAESPEQHLQEIADSLDSQEKMALVAILQGQIDAEQANNIDPAAEMGMEEEDHDELA